jgi:teichuronic acid biosynthesis glycosyltransferase TuaG
MDIIPTTKIEANVSVIIPCYNCSTTIERAIKSIIDQTKLPKEVILIDDKSTDDGKTLNKLNQMKKKYEGYLELIIIELPVNSGPGKARNVGWEIAKSKYIAFLDSDDSWHRSKIEIQSDFMDANPQFTLTSHLSEISDEKNNDILINQNKLLNGKKIKKFELLFNNSISTRTVMVKRDIPLRFSPEKRRSEDYLLWLEIIFSNNHLYRLNEVLASSYKGEFGIGGLTGDLHLMEKAELDTYKKIKPLIGKYKLIYFLFTSYSYLKFIRRLVITKFNKLGKPKFYVL